MLPIKGVKKMINTNDELRKLLNEIDHHGYPAYKKLKGAYSFGEYVLSIDHVQGDPFAAPSKVSVCMKGNVAKFNQDLYNTPRQKVFLEDLILRHFQKEVSAFSFKAKGSGKSGLMSVSKPGQEVLNRSACCVDEATGDVILRMEIGFPANGRTVNSRELIKIFFEFLPKCVERSLKSKAYSMTELDNTSNLAKDITYIREWLEENDMVSFIANGSILPRESGVSMKPMKDAVPFKNPKSLEVTLNLPHKGEIKGMGIKKGVTLIVGGGYHGKSTILKAMESGVYDHIAGDGREYCITEETALKLRAEDGRSIRNVDISMFINHLPNKKDTVHFDTEDASGSTSQAGNVVEAMECGSRTFLIDEDTSATNFMVRDELMQRVVKAECEPITPFVDRIKALYRDLGISTILVAGSCGSYFKEADVIIQMDEYEPYDITDFAKSEAEKFIQEEKVKDKINLPVFDRYPKYINKTLNSKNNRDRRDSADRIKVKTIGLDTVCINHDNIDTRYLEQLVDNEQMNTLGNIIATEIRKGFGGDKTLIETVDGIMKEFSHKGFKAFSNGDYISSGMAMPRPQEIFGCINRYRKIMF